MACRLLCDGNTPSLILVRVQLLVRPPLARLRYASSGRTVKSRWPEVYERRMSRFGSIYRLNIATYAVVGAVRTPSYAVDWVDESSSLCGESTGTYIRDGHRSIGKCHDKDCTALCKGRCDLETSKAHMKYTVPVGGPQTHRQK